MGFPGWPGYPAHPVAARLCYAIAEGCAPCTEHALDDAAGDLGLAAAIVAYTTEVALRAGAAGFLTQPPVIEGWPHALRDLDAPAMPDPDFTDAARAAYEASPASCAGNGIPAARETLRRISPQRRAAALIEAVRILSLYQPRTERGRAALMALATPA